MKRHAIQYMEQCGSFEYTKTVVRPSPRSPHSPSSSSSPQLKDLSVKIYALIEERGHNAKLLELMGMLESVKH